MQRFIRFAAAAACLAATAAFAQSDYPNRPSVIVLGIGAGSGADIGLRLYAERLGKRLGQQFVVENRPGAATILGTEYGMRQQPNGYNLVSLFAASTILPATHKNVPFDPVKDFMPISKLAESEFALAVTPTLPVNSMQELIKYARANPGKLTYASSGVGAQQHLGMELFKLQEHLDILHVPHKSITDAVTGVQGGHTDMVFTSAAGIVAPATNGRLRLIGITGNSGLPALPQVRTMESQDVGYMNVVRGWYGLAAPLKTPPPVITRLNAEINAIAKSPDFAALLAKSGAVAAAGTPEEMRDLMKHELETWAHVVREAKVEKQ